MSSNNPQQPPKNYQYASSTPSVSSLLNLPQVQDKKKSAVGVAGVTGLASGMVGKPGAVRTGGTALGLAPTKPPLGTLKLKKNEPPLNTTKVTETKVASVTENKVSSTTEEVKLVETKAPYVTTAVEIKSTKVTSGTAPKITSSGAENKLVTKPIAAKVEKPKTEKHSHPQSQSHSHSQTQAQLAPNDHFDPSHWRLFVGNLGPEVTDSLLLNTFKNPYPSTSKVLIIRDWKTQKSKGYAFVAFADGKEFLRALKEMNGKWIGNRQCIIKKSEHQPKFQ